MAIQIRSCSSGFGLIYVFFVNGSRPELILDEFTHASENVVEGSINLLAGAVLKYDRTIWFSLHAKKKELKGKQRIERFDN